MLIVIMAFYLSINVIFPDNFNVDKIKHVVTLKFVKFTLILLLVVTKIKNLSIYTKKMVKCLL